MKRLIIGASALVLLSAPAAVLAETSNSSDDKRPTVSCEERQQALDKKAERAMDRAEKRLNGLNIVFSGIQTYAQGEDVNIENYDSLSANAISRQTAATDAVEAIQAPDLNCDDGNNKDNGNKELNQDIKDAQKALSAYRKEVMKLFEISFES